MKRILSIASYKYLPARTGGEIGIADFHEYLGRYTNLTVAAVQANQPEGPLSYKLWPVFSNSRFRYINIFYCFPLAKAIREQQVQLLHIEHPYMGWLVMLLQAMTGRGFAIHSRNIEADRFRSMGERWWPLLRAYEKWVHRKALYSFFISREDAEKAIRQYKLDPKKVGVATHGITPPVSIPDRKVVRPQVCAAHGIPEQSTIYYFNGAMGYLPNQQAVRTILAEVYPRLEAQKDHPYVIMISGKGLPEDLQQQIAATKGKMIYTGFVPSMADYLVAVDIFINPVIEGGGVKTKVLEALAYHKTIVSTFSGAIGVNTATCGDKLRIAPDNNWDQFITLMKQHDNIDAPTPQAFFDYYNNDNVARGAAATMQTLV